MTQQTVTLPDDLADKAASWPEVRMGVNRVTVVLRDGSRIGGVLVAGNRAVGIYTASGAAPLHTNWALRAVNVLLRATLCADGDGDGLRVGNVLRLRAMGDLIEGAGGGTSVGASPAT